MDDDFIDPMEAIVEPPEVDSEEVVVRPAAAPSEKARPRQPRKKREQRPGTVEDDEQDDGEGREAKKKRSEVLAKRSEGQALKEDPPAAKVRNSFSPLDKKYVNVSQDSPVMLHCQACKSTLELVPTFEPDTCVLKATREKFRKPKLKLLQRRRCNQPFLSYWSPRKRRGKRKLKCAIASGCWRL